MLKDCDLEVVMIRERLFSACGWNRIVLDASMCMWSPISLGSLGLRDNGQPVAVRVANR